MDSCNLELIQVDLAQSLCNLILDSCQLGPATVHGVGILLPVTVLACIALQIPSRLPKEVNLAKQMRLCVCVVCIIIHKSMMGEVSRIGQKTDNCLKVMESDFIG